MTEQNSLLRFVKNDEERELAIAVVNFPQIVQIPVEQVINLVALWRMYIGVPKTDVAEELAFLSNFIIENYGHMTVGEIELAIRLSVMRKLKDTEFNGYFSALYVSKVLESYLYYRKITLADSIREREIAIREEKERNQKPSPEEQAKRFQQLFRNFYQEWKDTGTINDPFSLAYNYLRNNKLMHVPQNVVAEAQAYGKKKADEQNKNRQKKGLKTTFSSIDLFQMEEKKWARNYCVQKYFENVDIDILCNKIIPEHFH